MVPLARMQQYVRRVKLACRQPVTIADNYEWWVRSGAAIAPDLDFIGVHTYPIWEGKTIEEALGYTVENIDRVRTALPGRQVAILEAGWASTASEFGERASRAHQARYIAELSAWANQTGTPVFFFEAFDEPWKGDPGNPSGAEKHWGLWDVDRVPKAAVQGSRP